MRASENVKNGLKRVQVGDYGLKLWENDALTLISSFRPVLDQKSEKLIKLELELKQMLKENSINNQAKVNDNSFMLIDNSSKLVSDYDNKEFDEWMNDLIKKNGTTEY